MPVTTDRQEVTDITLRSDTDSIVIRFEKYGAGYAGTGDGKCYEVFSDGTVQVWSPSVLLGELNPIESVK